MADDQSAMINSHLDAPPAAVYAALTDAEALTAWYWPAALEPKATSDPSTGGYFALTTNNPDMGFGGEYLALDPPARIVQSWRWQGDERESRVTIDLVPAGEGTDLTVVHDRLDAEEAAKYQAGWESCLARLPGYLRESGNR